ncbi:MAG: AMP-binding protein [Cumulibacter sp.]
MEFAAHEEVVGDVGALRALRDDGDRVVFIHGDRSLTARESASIVYRMARVLAQAGVRRGSAVAMLSMNLPEAYLAQLAVEHLAARYTPLHPMGSLADHAFILEDAEIDVLLYDARLYSERASDLRGRGVVRQSFALGPDGDLPDAVALASVQSDEPTAPTPRSGADIQTLYYTGGTTGRPKGVMHTGFGRWYTQALSVGNAAAEKRDREPRILISTPISHAGGTAIGPMLMRGGSVVLVDRFEPAEFLRLVEQHQVTQTFLVPTMIYVLLDYLREHPKIDVSSLEHVTYGAAPMSPTRLKEAIERIGPVFVQGYGQTEAGVGILNLPAADHRLDRLDLLSSAGRPMPGVVARILREDGTQADVGEVGELCLRGPFVMKGYWKNPELTEHALRGGWLHTDDLGFVNGDGYITLVDRRKDMIISGGFNVYPSEVEAGLSEHPAVSSCAVIGVPDEKWGEAVKAYVVLKDGAAVTEEDLIAHARVAKGRVNAPKSVEFIDELPLTPVGKLDKKSLRMRASLLH